MRSTPTPPVAAPADPRGYSLPLSPSGEASMLTPPPWHFSGEVLMVEYRVDPALARDFLPAGLTLGPDPGAAALVFAEWQWCSESGEELADPSRNQFAELALLLAAEYAGQPVARCPGAWVDQTVPLVRGWVQGMPKQFGIVHMSRPVAVGRAGPRLAPDGVLRGALDVGGRRAVEAAVTLHHPAPEPPALHVVPLAHSLVFPPWVSPAPARTQLVSSIVSQVEFAEVWTGTASIQCFDLPGRDFARLAPVEVGRGFHFSYAETLHGGRLLGEPGNGAGRAGQRERPC